MSEDFWIPIVVSLIAALPGILALRSLMKRAQTEADQAESEGDKADSSISQTNISTALLLLERVRKENLDLVTRAEACEIASLALTDELRRLKNEVKNLQSELVDADKKADRQMLDLQEGAKRLYYQLKSRGETPAYTPPSISGPLMNQHE